MKNSSKNAEPLLWIFLSVLSWSTVASACKWSLTYIHPFWMLFFSSLTASLVLFLLILLNPSCSIQTRLSLKWIGLGLLNPFLYYLLLFEAYRISPAQEALVLNYTWAILLALGSAVVYKQKLSLLTLVGLILSFIGVWILTAKGLLSLPGLSLGNGFALVSAFVWAYYWIVNLKNDNNPLLALFVQFSTASLAILIFAYLFGPTLNLNKQGLFGSIYLGFFEMSLPFFWWLLALRKSKQTSQIVHWIYLSPVLSMIWIAIILKETVLPASWIGLGFVIGGMILSKVPKEKMPENPEVLDNSF